MGPRTHFVERFNDTAHFFIDEFVQLIVRIKDDARVWQLEVRSARAALALASHGVPTCIHAIC